MKLSQFRTVSVKSQPSVWATLTLSSARNTGRGPFKVELSVGGGASQLLGSFSRRADAEEFWRDYVVEHVPPAPESEQGESVPMDDVSDWLGEQIDLMTPGRTPLKR